MYKGRGSGKCNSSPNPVAVVQSNIQAGAVFYVDYIDFSSYEMKKKMMSVLIQWSFQGPLLRPGKNVMLQKITRKQESCVKGSNDIGNIGVC